MAKVRKASEPRTLRQRPAIDPEDRENQVIAAAVNLAEQQILDGTASPSVIVHFLKLGSTKEKLEKEILEKQKELITAKTEALHSSKRIEELYEKAMIAMTSYSGESSEENEF